MQTQTYYSLPAVNTANPPQEVKIAPILTPGINVSKHDSPIDWDVMAAAGIKFAFIGTHTCDILARGRLRLVTDPYAVQNLQECAAASIEPCAYQLIDYTGKGLTPSYQFALADQVIRKSKVRVKTLALDYEQKNGKYPALPKRITCLETIRSWMMPARKAGYELVFYTNHATLKYLAPIPAWLKTSFELWLAWPDTQAPAPVQSRYLQYTWNGESEKYGCKGSKTCDLDWRIDYEVGNG